MSLSLQQSDYFWADLLKQVDWYREHATPEIAERFVDIVKATLHKLMRTPAWAGGVSQTGRSWKGCARSESSGHSIGCSSSTGTTLKRCLLKG